MSQVRLFWSAKRTRKREFLDEMNRVVPWTALVALVAPFAPEGRRGRPPFDVETMMRIHFMQQWFTLSDPAMEEALHDVPLFREFAGLDNWNMRLPDESTILRFRHLLEKYKLAAKIRVEVKRIAARAGVDAARGYRGGCHVDCRTDVDEECEWRARSRDASNEERQRMVFRHESACAT